MSQDTSQPTLTNHQWAGLQAGGERIVIAPDDPQRRKASFYVSVRGHRGNASFRMAAFLEEPVTHADATRSSGIGPLASVLKPATVERPGPDYVQCSNCAVWLPEATAFRHEAFCKRNVMRCPTCLAVVQLSQKDFHTHCAKVRKDGRIARRPHCSYSARAWLTWRITFTASCVLPPSPRSLLRATRTVPSACKSWIVRDRGQGRLAFSLTLSLQPLRWPSTLICSTPRLYRASAASHLT